MPLTNPYPDLYPDPNPEPGFADIAEGLPEAAAGRCAVAVDLDGTLVSGNTFTMFVRFLLKACPACMAGICWQVARRKLRLCSHEECKLKILELVSDRLSDDECERFCLYVASRCLNDRVLDLVRSKKERGWLAVLATAAPERYALPLARGLGFDACIATPDQGPECSRDRKAFAVKHWMCTHNARLALVVTDHADDLPLSHLAPTAWVRDERIFMPLEVVK